MAWDSYIHLDQRFNTLLTRLSVLAVLIFAVDVYVLKLKLLFSGIPIFAYFPTLEAGIFMGIFIGYLCMIWYMAFDAYQKLYRETMTRGSYVKSQVVFSVPVLLPWFMLSIIVDILNLLPFPDFQKWLNSIQGQVIFFILFLMVAVILGPMIIQKIWNCRPLEPGIHRQRIADLCRRSGIRYADILYWPIFGGRMITAGVMGLISRFRYILVTDALFAFLNEEEIDAVIAHEIGHVKRKHLHFYLLFFAGYMLLMVLLYSIIDAFGQVIDLSLYIWVEPLFELAGSSDFQRSVTISAALGIVTISIFMVYFRFIFGYFMRNFERQADTYVFSMFNTADPLLTTFEKITLTSGQSPEKPNWHHFSIQERMDYLKKCESDRSWISRHDVKVRNSIIIYMVALIVISTLGFSITHDQSSNELSMYLRNKALIRYEQDLLEEIKSNPDNPIHLRTLGMVYQELRRYPEAIEAYQQALRRLVLGKNTTMEKQIYSNLGLLYYEIKDYPSAVSAYEKALQLDPANPEIQNNYAWLLATCEDLSFRDPPKALALARQAADKLPMAFVLDTLAEALFINGHVQEAVETEQKALSMATGNVDHYENQLAKYRRALGNQASEPD